jgi:hypothetical protein
LFGDFCWFGNTAENYDASLPTHGDFNCVYRLFLNATVSPDTLSVFNTSNIIFKLYLYNTTSGNTSEYDNSLFKNLNLSINAVNGNTNTTNIYLEDTVQYMATKGGRGSVTASISTTSFTVYLNNLKIDSNILVESQVITLKDSNGNPVTNATITVDLNGAKTYTTDTNGQVKISTAGLTPQVYTAKITFAGNDIYNGSSADAQITVNKANPILKAKNKAYKAKKKVKKFSIILNDNIAKPIAKAKITLKIGKKAFSAKTNSKGKATFKITKLTKKGKYKATIAYKGNNCYNKVSKKVKLVLK